MNIRQLALDTVAQIRAQQHWYTAPSRKRALNQFEAFLNTNPYPSNQAIIDEAKRVKNDVEQNGWFGWNGKGGSSFLTGFNSLITNAYTQLENFRLAEVVRVMESNRLKTLREKLRTCEPVAKENLNKVKNQLLVKLAPKAEKLNAEALFRSNEEARVRLENTISAALKKYHPSSHELARWNRHLSDTRNGVEDLRKPCFDYSKLNVAVRSAIEAYEDFIDKSPEYLKELRRISIEDAKLEDARIKIFSHAAQRLETRMNRLALGITEHEDLDKEAHEEEGELAAVATKRVGCPH